MQDTIAMSIVTIKYEFILLFWKWEKDIHLLHWFTVRLFLGTIVTIIQLSIFSSQALFVRCQAKDHSQQAVRVQTHVLEAKT